MDRLEAVQHGNGNGARGGYGHAPHTPSAPGLGAGGGGLWNDNNNMSAANSEAASPKSHGRVPHDHEYDTPP